jgi:hypothetical protein
VGDSELLLDDSADLTGGSIIIGGDARPAPDRNREDIERVHGGPTAQRRLVVDERAA